jgi:putative ABC transport system permease protein
VALSGLGGLVGTLLGVLATIGYATSQGWPPVVPLVSVAGGCYGALVVGMAAGVYPSVRASRLTLAGPARVGGSGDPAGGCD